MTPPVSSISFFSIFSPLIYRHSQRFKRWCTCQSVYIPQADNQRYCHGCKDWYHVACAEKKDEGHPPDTELSELERILQAPGMRGGGIPGVTLDPIKGSSWTVVGTLPRQLKVKEWQQAGLPEDWRTILREDFITDMTTLPWAVYTCPVCAADI